MSQFWRVFGTYLLGGVLTYCSGWAIASPLADHLPNLQALNASPLAFEVNQGQADPAVKFLARSPAYKIFLTADEAVMVFGKKGKSGSSSPGHAAVVRMRFEGANHAPVVQGEEPLDFKANYFRGGDSAASFTDIPHHGRVKYASIYAGVDLIYYGNNQQLEYDLIVAPHADPGQIKMRLLGADKLSASAAGELHLATGVGDVIYRKPVAYQDIAGKRTEVAADYQVADNGEVSFRLGRYDGNYTLVIDPIVSYSSFLWSSATGVAVDGAGNAYVVGTTNALDLPATSGYVTKLTGKLDAYVAKLDPTGKIVYATYLGARNAYSWGNHIAVDAAGSAYISGTTDSGSFPMTAGAYQTSSRTGGPFITKLNPAGNGLAYSTFFKGVSIDWIALDTGGNLYATGGSFSLATTPGAFQPLLPGTANTYSPFVAKLNSGGSALVYATYLGGSGTDEARSIAVDASGHAYITGTARSANFPVGNAYQPVLKGTADAFVSKLNPNGTGLIYSTFLGGTEREHGNGIAVNAAGEAFVVGQTYSQDFPITAGVFQPRKGYPNDAVSNGFVAKLGAGGNALAYSTFLGGSWCSICWSASYDNDAASVVAVDAAGYAYVGGIAKSPAFPVVDAVQQTVAIGNGDARWPFLAKITPTADQLVYSMLIGDGTSYYSAFNQIAADADGSAVAVNYNGTTNSCCSSNITTHPITAGAALGAGPSFILKLSSGKYATSVVSSANPAARDQSITLTAKVLNPRPGGTVTFLDGANTLGSVPVFNGVAAIVVPLTAGVHKITALYSLDGKVSLPIYQIVNSN